ncbi:MAG: FHA domain-containing protein [Spirochaetota bacterium]
MDITVYKRAKDGKKINDEIKTKAISIKFKERSVDVVKNIYIGRNEANAISIKDDPLISRKHALIEHVKGCYYISDLCSTNGTYVNNHPVPKDQKIELKSGDVIRIGKTELRVS